MFNLKLFISLALYLCFNIHSIFWDFGYNHSVTGTKDFVFITGGETETNEDTFDILVLRDNFIVKGPNLNYKRKGHCSFIIKNYLYVLFGEVDNNCKTTVVIHR